MAHRRTYGTRPRPTLAVIVSCMVLVASAASSTTSAVAVGGGGNDISWPQCRQPFPAKPAFAIVGVNDGRPGTGNPCLATEYRWAATSGPPALYMNTANPGALSEGWYQRHSPSSACAPGRDTPCAYNYGYEAARLAYDYANSTGASGPGHTWWLDVETTNSWPTDLGANLADITGAIDYLHTRSVVVGLYSTRYQWGVITGGGSFPGLPNWIPGAGSAAQAARFCSQSYSFSGGPVMLSQYVTQGFDFDYACPGSDTIIHPPQPVTPRPSSPLGNLLRRLSQVLNGAQH